MCAGGFHQRLSERVHRPAQVGVAGRRAQRTRCCRGWRSGAIFFGLAPLGLFSGAVIAALLVGIGGQLVARSSRLKDETAIGALYTVAFSRRHHPAKIQPRAGRPDALSLSAISSACPMATCGSSIRWVSLSAVSLVSLQSVRSCCSRCSSRRSRQSLGVPVARLNYLLITLIVLAMIASLQAVGVVLSVGLLVLPAATVYLLSDSYRALSWYGGLLGAGGSMRRAYCFHIGRIFPSGPAIVLVLGVFVRGRAGVRAALRRAGAFAAGAAFARSIARALAIGHANRPGVGFDPLTAPEKGGHSAGFSGGRRLSQVSCIF